MDYLRIFFFIGLFFFDPHKRLIQLPGVDIRHFVYFIADKIFAWGCSINLAQLSLKFTRTDRHFLKLLLLILLPIISIIIFWFIEVGSVLLLH